jgi:regulator of cell morphogenesis and NO signaling
MSVTTTSTVRELAVTIPGATRVFEEMGIDYCCGGKRTLADACREFNKPVAEVVRRLEAAGQAIEPGDKLPNWQSESLSGLSTHIVDTHHFFTKQELARLEKLLDKVCARHGENHPELAELRGTFHHLKQDLIPHMLKEEQVLFPHIARMEEAVSEQRAVPVPFFVTVQNPVRMMMTEHDTAGELLGKMRKISGNYSAPPDACISYQTLYEGLQDLEADLHQHIHLENNILFPRAVDMERAAEPAWQTAGQEHGEHRCFGQ